MLVGQRFYLNDRFGFGVKGWGGYAPYDYKAIYHTFGGTDINDSRLGDFFIKADSVLFGIEGQAYVDFINTRKLSLGMTLGAGFELTQFYNATVNTYYTSTTYNLDTIDSYSDNTWLASAGAHVQLGLRNRFEVGYRIKDYQKVARLIRSKGDNFRHVGFNVNHSIYLNYTFVF